MSGARAASISCAAGCTFVDESQLRAYFIDHLLEAVKDKRTQVLQECQCFRGDRSTGFADYMVRLDDRWIPVEAKLNRLAERDLAGQSRKYVQIDRFQATTGKGAGQEVVVEPQPTCLVVDSEGIWLLRDGALSEGNGRVWGREEIGRMSVQELRSGLRQAVAGQAG